VQPPQAQVTQAQEAQVQRPAAQAQEALPARPEQ